MDTEFPGVVARPVGSFKNSGEYHYQTLRRAGFQGWGLTTALCAAAFHLLANPLACLRALTARQAAEQR